MDLEHMNNEELNQNLLRLVRQERRITSEILDSLKEVEGRKLFAQRGHDSLFSYCTEFLGYSESAAQRRISSMRLLKEVPEIKSKITSGELSLSNMSKAASFFRQEKKINQKNYNPAEKIKILESLSGKTQKQAEVQLIQISPKPFEKIDRERVITPEITELRVTLDQETMKKLNRLKELKPNLSTQELIEWMLSRCLKQIDPLEQAAKNKVSTQKSKKIQTSPLKSLPLRTRTSPLRRTLSKSLKRQVWQRDLACCQFKDHSTGRACQSKGGLEIDHIQPLSLGGDNRIENLRLLCREHHKLFTRQSFY